MPNFWVSSNSKAQPRLVHFFRRNEDRAAAFRELVGHVHLLERGDDRAAVLLGQVAEEHLEIRALAVEHGSDDEHDDRGEGDDERELLLVREARQAGLDALPERRRPTGAGGGGWILQGSVWGRRHQRIGGSCRAFRVAVKCKL
jgi:hypothetical protein